MKQKWYDCQRVKVSYLLDIDAINVMYALLVKNLRIIHPGYRFEIAPIVVGLMGCVQKCLVTYMKLIWMKVIEIKFLTRRMQVKSIFGSVRIGKTFLNFIDFKMCIRRCVGALSNIFDGAFFVKLVNVF